eukprot:c8657_g1_i1.p1 GENE.c8657_g1_i1~~c8657_g1_i1.p1  ORF type:complete len:318 (+),score=154.64 c8657_g1_i1:25-954(+)
MEIFGSSPESDQIDQIILNAYKEDIGSGFVDLTSAATIDPNTTAQGKFLAKADGVIAGIDIVNRVFALVDKNLRVQWTVTDGTFVTKGTHFGTVDGHAISILSGERLALNILQRMSGIATLTHTMINRMGSDSRTKILDTRKTAPGLRVLDKLAVRIGGGTNHRFGLFDMILIKDNHVTASGGVTAAVKNAQKFLSEKRKNSNNDEKPILIEVETRTLDEVKEAVALDGIHRIMLDNMVRYDSQTGVVDVSMLQEALKIVNGKVPTEASGNVNLETIGAIASTGVDFVSVGALTHSVQALDISLKITLQ